MDGLQAEDETDETQVDEGKKDRAGRQDQSVTGVAADSQQRTKPITASFIFRRDQKGAHPETLHSELEARLVSFLRERGVPEDRIAASAAEGTLDVLALESVILPTPRAISLREASARVGLDERLIRRIWRSFGFPEPRDSDEPILSQEDLEVLGIAKRYLDRGVDEKVLIQLVRIIGSSLARIAEAEVGAVQTAGETLVGAADPAELETLARLAGKESAANEGEAGKPMALEELVAELVRHRVDELGRLLDYGHRRHLIVAARRQVTWSEGTRAGVKWGIVGFADLVGFTAMSQQLDPDELAERVERFADLSYDIIAARQGRVVKMIGDEVMFVFEDTVEAARASLELADVYSEDRELSAVRVGLSKGELVFLDGDYYGPVVNLASRIVNIALAGSVVVSESVYEDLKENDEFELRAMRPRRLKGIGRVRLWVLRRPGTQRLLSPQDLRQLRSQAVSEILGEGI
jgi:adenylate cyclase